MWMLFLFLLCDFFLCDFLLGCFLYGFLYGFLFRGFLFCHVSVTSFQILSECFFVFSHNDILGHYYTLVSTKSLTFLHYFSLFRVDKRDLR